MKQAHSSSALAEFASECEEVIQRISVSLENLEKGVDVTAVIDALYRDVHTLKGSSQLFGFTLIGRLSHAFEASLGPVRKMRSSISPLVIDKLFECIALLDRMVKQVSTLPFEPGDFYMEVEALIPQLIDAVIFQFGGDKYIPRDCWVPFEQLETMGSNTHVDSTRVDTQALDQKRVITLIEPDSNSRIESVTDTHVLVAARLNDDNTYTQVQDLNLERMSMSGSHNTAQSQPSDPRSAEQPTVAPADTTVRVQVELLDKLMNLIGELVLVRNQMLQYQSKNDDLDFMNLSQNLDVVTSDLQSEVMKTRMQPIGNVIGKFQRVVRDLSKELGKQIDLTLQGSETELDKTLLEAIKDPLTHLVRNSCDHGIESPDDRRKSGKPITGHLLIRAFHEGGQFIIEISDDGKGLSADKIVAKAIEKGLLTQERAARLNDREIFNLIFLPGFSTAHQVSSVSGRGVGMDVVKTNIEKIGGTVDLSSQAGRGTTIKLKIPLTLAIVPALIIKQGGQRFAIPQVKLVELVRVEQETDDAQIEYLQSQPVYRLRGTLLPLVSLKDILSSTPSPRVEIGPITNIVVLSADGRRFGLIVDEILDTTDIVVKPLSQFLKTISVFSGATIMGDGTVALILDVSGAAQKAHISAESSTKEESFQGTESARAERSSDAQEFLLFKVQSKGVHSIPLCLVHRLEEFSRSNIELSGERRIIQYRGTVLPIICLNSVLGYQSRSSESTREVMSVIVIKRSDRYFGIEVDEIQDVVSVNSTIDDSVCDRPELLGNVIHDNRVFVVVDALGVIDKEIRLLKRSDSSEVRNLINPISQIDEIRQSRNPKKLEILYVEDVAFFRKHVAKCLTRHGFNVTTADNGRAALKMIEESDPGRFDLIVSDIEMPEMTGLELARALRKIPDFDKIPLIALTTRFTDRDIAEGRQAGFNSYQEKLNEENLISAIDALLAKGRSHPETPRKADV